MSEKYYPGWADGQDVDWAAPQDAGTAETPAPKLVFYRAGGFWRRYKSDELSPLGLTREEAKRSAKRKGMEAVFVVTREEAAELAES